MERAAKSGAARIILPPGGEANSPGAKNPSAVFIFFIVRVFSAARAAVPWRKHRARGSRCNVISTDRRIADDAEYVGIVLARGLFSPFLAVNSDVDGAPKVYSFSAGIHSEESRLDLGIRGLRIYKV